jgi:serum/glucocorticoid-regulated kinase 2
VVNKKYKKEFAMKQMLKKKIIDKRSEVGILYERDLLSRMTHPFIVNMHFSFQDSDNLYLIMDYISGGDLG